MAHEDMEKWRVGYPSWYIEHGNARNDHPLGSLFAVTGGALLVTAERTTDSSKLAGFLD
jgi:hypothetical protein